jgi:hypothetical protein
VNALKGEERSCFDGIFSSAEAAAGFAKSVGGKILLAALDHYAIGRWSKGKRSARATADLARPNV